MKQKAKITSWIVLGLLGVAGVANAQTISELTSLVQMSKAVLGSNAMIDHDNPDSVSFQSSLDGQLVELNLKANRLNDTFVTVINYAPSMRKIEPKARMGVMSA